MLVATNGQNIQSFKRPKVTSATTTTTNDTVGQFTTTNSVEGVGASVFSSAYNTDCIAKKGLVLTMSEVVTDMSVEC